MGYRFTIRDLLWLTLVVALAVGWFVDSHRLSQDEWNLVRAYRMTNALGPLFDKPKEWQP